jgi:hypothetical protein
VIPVKHVQAESAVGLPMVHGLERDQRQPPIDGDLGQGGVLHAMRPSPEDLSHIEFRQIFGLYFGQQNDVATREELSRVLIPPTRSASASSVAANSAP